MKNKAVCVLAGFLLFIGFSSCKQKAKKSAPDETVVSGKITLVADESFQPIVDEEAYVF